MRIPMPVEREKARLALEAAMLRACGLEDDLNVIHNEIVGNVIEISIRLPQSGWPFAELCKKPAVSSFVAFHAALLKCLLLARGLEGSPQNRERLEAMLVDRNFGAAFAMMDEIFAAMSDAEKERFAIHEKSEGLYVRPELRVALYIVLNPRRKFIFNMQSSLASDLSLIKPRDFPRTCDAVPTLDEVRELALINLAQIRPDIVNWLSPEGLAILRKQKFKGWRGYMPDLPDEAAF